MINELTAAVEEVLIDEETQQLAGLVGRDSARHAEKDAGHRALCPRYL